MCRMFERKPEKNLLILFLWLEVDTVSCIWCRLPMITRLHNLKRLKSCYSMQASLIIINMIIIKSLDFSDVQHHVVCTQHYAIIFLFFIIVIGNSILCAITARRGNNKNAQHQWRVENIMRNYGHFIYASMNLCFMLSSAFCVNWLSVYYYNIEQVSVHTASHERWRVKTFYLFSRRKWWWSKKDLLGVLSSLWNIQKKYVRKSVDIHSRKLFSKSISQNNY